MVKTRLTSDPKMPVKDTSKIQSSEGFNDSRLPQKNSSEFSPKLWSRELRNRFVISDEKRSIRFSDNEVRPQRRLQNVRMPPLGRRSHYNLSQSEEEEEDEIFASRASSKRIRNSLRNREIPRNPITVVEENTAMHNSLRRQMNGDIKRDGMEDDQGDHEISINGIRRSTRQRKLKYDNYSDSWIVGAQTLVGYPMYGNSYSSKARNDTIKEDEEEEEEDEEDDIDDQKVDETELEDDEERESDGRDKEEESKDVNQRPRRNIVQNDNENTLEDTSFQDMYSRVKRPRPTRRDLYQIKTRIKNRENKSVHLSSSDDFSVEERVVTRERGRGRDIRVRKYHLRKKKPTVDRFVPEVAESRSRALREAFCRSARRRTIRRRRSTPSSSSSDDSDRHFDRKKPKNRSRCLTSVGDSAVVPDRGSKSHKGVGRLADVDPVILDTSIRFSAVGGLEEHVRCLQEMVVFPMLYSEVFSKFHITPPRGVLFHGPPGTGKTLIARALANECSQGDRKVSFFMRKGADCLSKWVGESERQLRLLFEQAHQSKPSIIFFDEIDGLAPVRSAKQDQIHASIVSTLLALMDGLDNRGDIVVIGATNRIDAIDPALRRPGRFDRELLFPLPANKERKEILRIHVSKWEKPPSPELVNHLAEMCVGFGGSDLRALCSEAVIHALRRKYPQIYKSSQKLLLNADAVQVQKIDFEEARRGIIPSSYRAAPAVARKLPAFLIPLLNRPLTELSTHLRSAFPSGFKKISKTVQYIKPPRLLIIGQKKQTALLSAVLLYMIEQCPVHTLDLASLFCQSTRTPEETCVQIFNEVRRSVPSILYLPGLSEWWDTVGNTVQAVFTSLLNQMDPCLPILLLATAENPLPAQIQSMFSVFRNEIYTVKPANEKEREDFFKPLILDLPLQPPKPVMKKESLPELPLAPPPLPPKLTESQLQAIYDQEENTLRELRIFLRQICSKLARNKQFFMFSKPVDVNEVPDYLSIIKEPMDLETMMTKIDLHKYTCAQDFLNDIDLLCRNALEYNPDRNPADKLIRHRACYLRDSAYTMIKTEMDSDFEEQCRGIRTSRASRAASPDRSVPDFVWTASNIPANSNNSSTPLPTSNNQTFGENNISNISEIQNNFNGKNLSADNSNSKSFNSSQNRLMRKRRNLWKKGFIRKNPSPKLNSSQSETLGSQIKERSKTESSDNVNIKKCDSNHHFTRSSNSINESAAKVCESKSNLTTNDEESDNQPLKKRKHNSSPIMISSQEKCGNTESNIINDTILENLDNAEEDYSSDFSNDDYFFHGDFEQMPPDVCDDNVVVSPSKRKLSSNNSNSSSVSCSNSTKKQLLVNKAALQKVLNDVVRATDCVTSLEIILDLYAQLKSVVNKYMKRFDRTSLPSDLGAEINRFVLQHRSLEIHYSSASVSDEHFS